MACSAPVDPLAPTASDGGTSAASDAGLPPPCTVGEPIDLATGIRIEANGPSEGRVPIDMRAIGYDLFISWIEDDGIQLARLDRDGNLLEKRRWIERRGVIEHRLVDRSGVPAVV